MKQPDGDSYTPQRGDVEKVSYADPDPTPGKHTGPFRARTPKHDERVAIRLVGHPFTYAVRVSTNERTGPQVTELTITADKGQTVDYGAVRAVPLRRLAHSATQWIERVGGLVGFTEDIPETHAQPDSRPPKVYEAAQHANKALALGLSVRPYVAGKLNVSKTTVDRLLKRARAEGWLSDDALPKRPQPQQRDTTTRQETDR
ncbi:hypothetical protein [Mycolicibacterium sp. CR10]|uniref:hypothetical protein n=1 Tax=Mycolicibacterium sp. CR10 TaxID=2562314 RepID=UPI0010C0D397|nr:hypothetical protein [Mycolicibacterium sp. CR10]